MPRVKGQISKPKTSHIAYTAKAITPFAPFVSELLDNDNVPWKSSELDAIPSGILKQFLPVLPAYITKMCNASLRDGILPTSQRSAIITPRLKNAACRLRSSRCTRLYRPISNLTFMSSRRAFDMSSTRRLPGAERTSSRPTVCLQALLTETTVLKVVADFLTAADRGEVF